MKFASFPKFALLLALACALTLALAGCGSAVSNLGLTQGNWAFSATSTAKLAVGPTFVVGGNLTQSGANLTGTMYISQSGCIVPQFVGFTGTVKGKDITLTSENFGGQVISVTASGTKDSLSGTYTVTGECADSGTVTASAVPSISATWSGTIPPVALGSGDGIAATTVSVALSQAATASEDGTFALSGTLTYTNSGCAVTGTITNGYLAGNFISFSGTTDDGAGSFSFDQVTLDSVTAPANMTGTYEDCNGPQSVTLTKQQ
jgi:hypothetical protein